MSFIRPTPPVTDPKICADIRHELKFGTPNTPQRIATLKHADEVYERSFARPRFRTKVRDWITGASHDAVKTAIQDTKTEFHLHSLDQLHPGMLLYFIERLAEKTL